MKSIGHSNLRYIKANKENKVEIIMTHTIMAEGTIKIGTDQTVRIGEFNLAGKVEAKVKVVHLYSTFQMGYTLPKALYM